MRQLSGQRAWLLQRFSALLLLAAVLAALLYLLAAPRPDWQQWRAFVGHPLGSICVLALACALAAHAWVGMRDVLLDYVHHTALRLILLALSAGAIAVTLLRILLIVAQAALVPT